VLLETMLKEQALGHACFRERPDRFIILAHAYGHLARGKPELVRLYERLFPKPFNDLAGRRFLLAALALCADDDTRAALDAWHGDGTLRDLRPEIDEVRTALAEKSLQLPRAREPREPLDLDLLWVDFFVTGDYPPVERILGILDRPDALRAKISGALTRDPDLRAPLFQTLKTLGMVDPEEPESLIDVDLDYLVSRRNVGATGSAADALRTLNQQLELRREDWQGFAMKGVADWSMASNVQHHPRLMELLKSHLADRPYKSQAHIRHWLEPHESSKPGDGVNEGVVP
jgi:hypothetical protein